ncbi:MAG: SDR family NAD(P)-dependent oxidoreductase [Candidatus Riflebacteria bacterium]|nr:SDR family NAD(P)-dependent oxidoreductase [Candidatus Riflebacteria bacterium]
MLTNNQNIMQNESQNVMQKENRNVMQKKNQNQSRIMINSGFFFAFPGKWVEKTALNISYKNGVVPFVDFISPSIKDLESLFEVSENPLFLRIFMPSEDILEYILRNCDKVGGLYLEASFYKMNSDRTSVKRIQESEISLGIMVTCCADFSEINRNFDLPIIARGNESGGCCGPLSAYLLLQLSEKQYSTIKHLIFIEGGMDIPGASAVVSCGVAGVVFSGACWGFKEAGEKLSSVSKSSRFNDVIRISDKNGDSFSFIQKPKPDMQKLRKELSEQSLSEWVLGLSTDALPAGQDVEFSTCNASRFETLESFIANAKARLLSSRYAKIPEKFALSESKLGKILGFSLPIIQGPMARITEKPAFLNEIKKSGAVPVAAFSSISPDSAEEILSGCEREGFCPGAGIIGLEMQDELVNKQIEICRSHKMPFILVAAPRPALIDRLLGLGHNLLVHAPHPTVLADFADRGVSNFILEGRESGGHIGPLASMVLWQLSLSAVQRRVNASDDPNSIGKFRIIFAGGISSGIGVRFLEALLWQYFPENVPVWGIQLGTAYLATREIVQTGAMSLNYRNKVLNEELTAVTGETVGLRARQVSTPFVSGIIASEEAALEKGLSFNERRHLFESENMGNLFRAVNSKEGDDGCFMAGEAIAILNSIFTIEKLHSELLKLPAEAIVSVDISSEKSSNNEPIAVIGMGCVFPGSNSPQEYFGNILAGKCFIAPMPEDRLESSIFFHPDKTEPVATYSRIAGFLRNVNFDPTLFRVPPRAAAAMDLSQKLSLMCARQALADAGYLDSGKKIDRDNFGVVIGNSMGGMAAGETLKAVYLNELRHRLGRIAEGYGCAGLVQRILNEMAEKNPVVDISEDTLPGELGSLIAGRIAATFDLHGPNFTIDAACGSSLAAVIASINALRLRQINAALCGGSDAQMDPGTFIRFAKVSALSGTGSFPFDHRADGFVMGEGSGLVLLKRFSDAIADGDRIYALILGVGQSSDGKGKGITAPNPEGQKRAITRAWENAGRSFEEIGYLEAHGTGTRVGDEIELKAAASLIARKSSTNAKIPVGSIKANIGHLKAAAGIAGLIKTIWMVNQRVIPPQIAFEKFPETWDTKDLPFEIVTEQRSFVKENFLAGVSGFGFGGTNHHVVVGETPVQKVQKEIVIPSRDKVALVFPGQGSQYINMLSTWLSEPEFRDTIDEADEVFQTSQPGFGKLSEIIFPDKNHSSDLESRLQNTLIAQPAILSVCIGLLKVARKKGLKFDMALGHSLGEYAALFSAGTFTLRSLLEIVCLRAQYMSSFSGNDFGAMGVIALPVSEISELINKSPGYVIAANINSPKQTVISGETIAVEAILEHFSGKGIPAKKLNVSAAFHSKIVSNAASLYRQTLGTFSFNSPEIMIPSNLSGEWYPVSSDENWREKMIDMLVRQLMNPVDFVNQIERAYSSGIRTFVEVGPKNILTRLISEILGSRQHICINLDHPSKDSRELLEKALITISEQQNEFVPSVNVSSVIARSQTESSEKVQKDLRISPEMSIEDTVLSVIEEISGYPKSMIKPDLDLEADLGIDTLKIFEIGGRLRSIYPNVSRKKVELIQLRTMKGILNIFRNATDQNSDATELISETPSEKNHPKTGIKSLQRFLLQTLRGKLDFAAYPSINWTENMHLTIKSSDNSMWNENFVRQLSLSKISANVWNPQSADFEMLENGKLPSELGNCEIYVHTITAGHFSRKTRRSFYQKEILSLFLICRLLGKRLKALVILFDTFHSSGTGFLTGVLPAFCQSVEKDFPGLMARAVSIEKFSEDESEMKRIVDHCLITGLPSFVGLSLNDEITFQEAIPKKITSSEEHLSALKRYLNSESVVLATGGGSGITAHVLRKLAQEYQPRLIILGRSSERNELAREFRNLGSEVWYISCDLSDGPAVDRAAELIKKVTSHIDLLVHGAGIEISRNLANKTPEEIDKVYRVKVAGLVNLLDAVGEENVGTVASFSSVASFYGNPGQVDYAAANGFLNQFAGSGKTRFLTLAWSAWEKIGMASRGPVYEILKSNEVEFIDPDIGVDFFLKELNDFLHNTSEKLRTVGFFGQLGDALGASVSHPKLLSSEIGSFLVDPVADPWLKDHSIDGRVIVPAVISLSGLIEGLLPPNGKYPDWISFENLRFFVPVKTSFSESVKFQIRKTSSEYELWAGQASDTSNSRMRLHLSCRPDFIPPDMAEKNRWRDDVYRMKLLLSESDLPFTLEGEVSEKENLKHVLFHGPAFQVLDRVRQWNQTVLLGIPGNPVQESEIYPLSGSRKWPFLLESALHGAGIYSLIRVSSRKFTFPSTVGRIDIDVEAAMKPGEKKVFAEFLERTIDKSALMPLVYCRYNVYVTDSEDKPVIRLSDLRMIAGQDEPAEKLSIFTIGAPIVICDRSFMAVKFSDAERILGNEAVLRDILTADELKIFQNLDVKKRKIEWLSGRMALKILVRDYILRGRKILIGLNDFSIKTGGNMPELIPEKSVSDKVAEILFSLRASISHGEEIGAAVVFPSNIGLDIERMRKLDKNDIENFLNPEEIASSPPGEEITLWTAKEAVSKVLGLGFAVKDFRRITLHDFGFGEPYTAVYTPTGKRFTVVTIKDRRRTASIVTSEA